MNAYDPDDPMAEIYEAQDARGERERRRRVTKADVTRMIMSALVAYGADIHDTPDLTDDNGWAEYRAQQQWGGTIADSGDHWLDVEIGGRIFHVTVSVPRRA